LRNVWGLLTHPYKTLRTLRVEQDLSQIFLLFISPAGFLLFSLAFFTFLKLFFHPLGLLGLLVNLILFVFLAASAAFFGYLGFWLFYYLRLRKRAKNVA
jgi:hypothetical protein